MSHLNEKNHPSHFETIEKASLNWTVLGKMSEAEATKHMLDDANLWPEKGSMRAQAAKDAYALLKAKYDSAQPKAEPVKAEKPAK